MRFFSVLLQLLLLLSTSTVFAVSSWGFTDATLSIGGKGGGIGAGLKEKIIERKPFAKPVTLKSPESLKIILTTQDGKAARRPHQAFLLLREAESGLDTSYAFAVKESGKAKLELSQKDLPSQFLKSAKPICANIVIGSFGSSKPYNERAFELNIEIDASAPTIAAEPPLRYGKLPEIHHMFRSDPKSPPMIITIFFTAAVLATLPTLLGIWMYLGGNVNHISNALSNAPLSHVAFFGSIFALEGIFFMYYTTWNLFQTLPVAAVVGSITFLSGSRALSEVQGRRLAGLR